MGRDEIDWGTVDRSDEPLANTTDDELLSVPELTDETLIQLEATYAEQDITDSAPEKTYEPGSQQECETCGRIVRVRKDGTLGVHKCEPKAQRGNRFETMPSRRPPTPKRVRDVGIAVLAWGVEETSAHILARPFGVNPDDVPTDLPDAEEMIGPPLDLLWPSIPDGAQRFIAKIADESELIACALAWGEWLKTLGKWTREQRAYQQRLHSERLAHAPTQFTTENDEFVGRVVPFTPA